MTGNKCRATNVACNVKSFRKAIARFMSTNWLRKSIGGKCFAAHLQLIALTLINLLLT